MPKPRLTGLAGTLLAEAQQQADIVLLGNPAGIKDWDWNKAKPFISASTKRLTASFGVAMSKHSVFAMVNVPQEQGEWSAELAKLILSGQSPDSLPITANRRWKTIANPGLARQVGLQLPESILQGAEIVESQQP